MDKRRDVLSVGYKKKQAVMKRGLKPRRPCAATPSHTTSSKSFDPYIPPATPTRSRPSSLCPALLSMDCSPLG